MSLDDDDAGIIDHEEYEEWQAFKAQQAQQREAQRKKDMEERRKADLPRPSKQLSLLSSFGKEDQGLRFYVSDVTGLRVCSIGHCNPRFTSR